MKLSISRFVAIALAALVAGVSTMAHAGDDYTPNRAQLRASQMQSAKAQAARAQAAQMKAAQARMMHAKSMQMRQAQAAQMRQAQMAKAGMATAMVTAATLAASDAGECSPYLAKWMMTKSPAWRAQYEACREDD